MPSVRAPQSIPICRAGCIKTAVVGLCRFRAIQIVFSRRQRDRERKKEREFESEVCRRSRPTLVRQFFYLLLAKQPSSLSRDKGPFFLERLDDIGCRLHPCASPTALLSPFSRRRKERRERERERTRPGVDCRGNTRTKSNRAQLTVYKQNTGGKQEDPRGRNDSAAGIRVRHRSWVHCARSLIGYGPARVSNKHDVGSSRFTFPLCTSSFALAFPSCLPAAVPAPLNTRDRETFSRTSLRRSNFLLALSRLFAKRAQRWDLVQTVVKRGEKRAPVSRCIPGSSLKFSKPVESVVATLLKYKRIRIEH